MQIYVGEVDEAVIEFGCDRKDGHSQRGAYGLRR
jgi:hypothetical protein